MARVKTQTETVYVILDEYNEIEYRGSLKQVLESVNEDLEGLEDRDVRAFVEGLTLYELSKGIKFDYTPPVSATVSLKK